MDKPRSAPETPHYWNDAELRNIEAATSFERHSLSATNYTAHHRKFHGASGCTLPSVQSITVRTLRRTPHE
jgi:hypothetical protein